MKKILLLAATFLSFAACKNDQKAVSKSTKDVVASNVDTSVSPTKDFFAWANGGWLKANSIPASESSWGIGQVLQEDIYAKMRKVSEDAAKTSAAKGSNEQKIGDFWTMGMDSAAIEKQGIEPLKPELDKIAAIKDINGVLDVAAELQTNAVSAMFAASVNQDEKNSSQYFFYLWQGGLGLPERDYYFNTDARNANIRAEYKKHLANMFKLVDNLPNTEGASAKQADAVFKIETFLAQSHRKIEALRDPQKNYNKMSINELQKLTPSVSWQKLMQKMGIKTDSVIVGQPEF